MQTALVHSREQNHVELVQHFICCEEGPTLVFEAVVTIIALRCWDSLGIHKQAIFIEIYFTKLIFNM